jgi:hypothetical protein
MPLASPGAAVTTLAVILVAVVAWFDYVTADFSLAVFYLAPVALATWYAGRVSGWSSAMLSAIGWLVGDLSAEPPLRPRAHALLECGDAGAARMEEPLEKVLPGGCGCWWRQRAAGPFRTGCLMRDAAKWGFGWFLVPKLMSLSRYGGHELGSGCSL